MRATRAALGCLRSPPTVHFLEFETIPRSSVCLQKTVVHCGIHSDILVCYVVLLPHSKRTAQDLWQNNGWYQSGCRCDLQSFVVQIGDVPRTATWWWLQHLPRRNACRRVTPSEDSMAAKSNEAQAACQVPHHGSAAGERQVVHRKKSLVWILVYQNVRGK